MSGVALIEHLSLLLMQLPLKPLVIGKHNSRSDVIWLLWYEYVAPTVLARLSDQSASSGTVNQNVSCELDTSEAIALVDQLLITFGQDLYDADKRVIQAKILWQQDQQRNAFYGLAD